MTSFILDEFTAILMKIAESLKWHPYIQHLVIPARLQMQTAAS
jgi:hypothetical protein